MAISQAMCTSFKKELMEAKHNFLNSGGNDFKLALYTSSASLGAGTTAYTTSNEASGTNYTAKGFGGDKTSTNGDFTIQFPTADASNAIIRIA